eukprot:TRINITY_DN1352_c0_g1_i5.p2 TRINITY_DN1352_c0_g1~~TRINITY_DN1352_c0_g1_i5.p2  ORF type:complete len:162 (+),score=37.78 TRINITY_DN1352_c0_g1_i5:758-1243(+)
MSLERNRSMETIDEVQKEIDALEIPKNRYVDLVVCVALYYEGRYDEAFERFKSVVEDKDREMQLRAEEVEKIPAEQLKKPTINRKKSPYIECVQNVLWRIHQDFPDSHKNKAVEEFMNRAQNHKEVNNVTLALADKFKVTTPETETETSETEIETESEEKQ